MRVLLLTVLLAAGVGCTSDEPVTAPATTAAQATAAPSPGAARVLAAFRPYPGARLVHATARNRVFRIPDGVPGAAVQRHYERQFRGWEHRDEQHGSHVEGHTVYIDYFWRDGRCVWLDVGVGAEGAPIPPKRTMSIWTSAGPRSSCA